MKRSSLKLIIRIMVLSILFLTVLFFSGNSYLSWLFGSKYTIESAIIEHKVLPDGRVLVNETITLNMRKPYSGLYRFQPGGRGVTIENPRFEVEGGEIQEIEYLKNKADGFSAKLWLVKKGSGKKVSPSSGSTLTLHVNYTVKGLIENGKDISQLFWKYWGEDWDSPVKKLTGIFEFPESFEIEKIYLHPNTKIETSGNSFSFTKENLPPNTFAETRFVFKSETIQPYSTNNSDLNTKDIEKIESRYTRKHAFRSIFPFASFGIITFAFFLIFKHNPVGKKQSAKDYTWEIPYKDSPDIVNSIMNLKSIPNKDGLDAILLDLYYKGYIDFEKTDHKTKLIIIKSKPGSKLTESEKRLFKIFLKYKEDNIFDFIYIKEKLLNSQEKANTFMELLVKYRKTVAEAVEKKHYFSTSGSDYAKMFSIIYFVMAFIMNFVIGFSPTGDLQLLSPFSAGIFWLTGSIIYLLPVKVFSTWSKKGKEYRDSWKKLERFLKDYSLLSSHKPEKVVLWDEYLIYATALGLADEVRKSFEKMELDLTPFNLIRDYTPGQHLLSLMDTMTTVTTAISYSSTSVESAGDASGGGGGGAF